MNMIDRPYLVSAAWDDEAQVWVAESDDVPGLVAEAASMPLLIEKLRDLIPELLEANNAVPVPPHIPVEITAHQRIVVNTSI
jgi:predicted RNase H-like HicB family nuclease